MAGSNWGNGRFVTFGCAGRRKLLNTARSRQIVISVLGDLVERGPVKASGFVVMPDHVHALLWWDHEVDFSKVIQTWKRLSSHFLIEYYRETSSAVLEHLKHRKGGREIWRVWTPGYYDYSLRSADEAREKLEYMHANPVKQGLCDHPEDYPWSSTRWYFSGKSVGVRIEPGF